MALEQIWPPGATCDDGRTCDGIFVDRERGVVIFRGQASQSVGLGQGEVAAELPISVWEAR